MSLAYELNIFGGTSNDLSVKVAQVKQEDIERLYRNVYQLRFDNPEKIRDVVAIHDSLSSEDKFVFKCLNPIEIDGLVFGERLSGEKLEAKISGIMKRVKEEYKYTVVHEFSHQEDDLKHDIVKEDLAPEYLFRLEMLSEVKARMAEGALALAEYNRTGDLSGFDNITSVDECKT